MSAHTESHCCSAGAEDAAEIMAETVCCECALAAYRHSSAVRIRLVGIFLFFFFFFLFFFFSYRCGRTVKLVGCFVTFFPFLSFLSFLPSFAPFLLSTGVVIGLLGGEEGTASVV